jgi:hypothetical protein
MAVFGRFYFKKTTNGNLIGEYSNHNMMENQTESADLIEFTGNFVGKYKTTWREDDLPIITDLTIQHKAGSNGRIFDLKWKRGNEELFIGQGFLCDNILIGDYTDKETFSKINNPQ